MRKLSLFSGIGGIDLAAKWTGIETVAFCEKESFPQQVLRKH
ncbi:DNA cytosine methyltransferase [Paenibacillus larvae]|nr:DNA cytosine methyltransferase [Paenibacillus larvae]MDT2277557.1 DNA cytosine methyltransferase [Paenibacillus larvae]